MANNLCRHGVQENDLDIDTEIEQLEKIEADQVGAI